MSLFHSFPHHFPTACLLLVFWILPTRLSAAESQPTPTDFVVVEREADSRVVEWYSTTVDEMGQSLVLTNRYTEVATGLHWLDAQGQWQNTVAELVPVAGGFLATQGPHQVALSEDLSTPGAVTLVTSDGKTLRSHPVLLAYVDRATGRSVRLADLKPSRGELVAANTVLYSDAFDTLAADVRAVYTASGFECDVILRRQPIDPAFFGLNPDTTDLAVYSEFFETRPTNLEAWEVPVAEGEQGADTRLEFGNMVMGRGRAFGLELEGEEIEVAVRKSWERLEERDFLIERTAWRDLQPLLSELP
ncbi:MAG: hypothetical protein KIT22_11440, partial [Verrucomicrobiae bacterium]|nr:hypothetical protein [Verrucomicrobiae bacterium]